jgi:hypothetical protein
MGIRTAAAGLLLTLLAACGPAVQPTAYAPAPAGGGSGYSEVWLDETRAEVRFAGNWRTDRQTVEQGLLYRAAELAAQREAPQFAVRDKLIEREVTETVETPPFPSWWYRDRYRWPGFYGGYGPFGPRVRTWTTYTGSMDIEVLPPGAQAPPDAIVHDTQAVLRRLAPQVLPQTGAAQ